jgi:hypothetical protein
MKHYQPQFLWAGLLLVCAVALFFAGSTPALAQTE